jgi:RNA polymerase sigma-70 factor (ECF subfamily)
VSEAYDAAWHRLYEECRFDLFRAAAFLVGPAEAEELVQDAFIRAIQRTDFFQTVKEPSAWLRTVVVRSAVSRLRRRRVWERLRLRLPVSEGRLPDPDLHAAITMLPAKQRAAIILLYFFGASYPEIADTLRVSDKSVGQMLTRAREALRRELDERP